MCIIVVKHEGSTLAKETLENCFHNNDDGAGFMYFDEDRRTVVGDKGYMTFHALWKALNDKGWIDSEDRVHADRGIILHFRLGTHGTKTAPLTHPFPISAQVNDLRALNWTADWGIVHNGVISSVVDWNSKENLSDTMIFIRDYLADEKVLSMLEHGPCVKLMFLGVRSSNKFAFLNSTGALILIGNFVKGQDGNIYSNSSFQEKVQKYSTYAWHGSPSYHTSDKSPTAALMVSSGKVIEECTFDGPCATCDNYKFYAGASPPRFKHYCSSLARYLFTLTPRGTNHAAVTR